VDGRHPTVRRIREATKAAVEKGIAFLREAQKNDPNPVGDQAAAGT
jgi:hypothetical protein